ncbi:MAG: hypothetical protein R3302_01505 [Sulfurimonadaceae bacterium]|nr:hypothetical protein [Sulfurimonadaceae bacterium]
MTQEHRDIIRRFLDDPIHELSIYSGYNGGIVLKISTIDLELVRKIQDYCDTVDVECNVKHNRNLAVYEVYCVVPDNDIYSLKNGNRYHY